MRKQWKQWHTLFWGPPQSLQMVIAAMKLKDACSLEEKLWPTWTAFIYYSIYLLIHHLPELLTWFTEMHSVNVKKKKNHNDHNCQMNREIVWREIWLQIRIISKFRNVCNIWIEIFSSIFTLIIWSSTINNEDSYNKTLSLWFRWKRICLQYGGPGFNPWLGKISGRKAWQSTPVYLPREFPWTEEPGRLQSIGSQSQTQLSD